MKSNTLSFWILIALAISAGLGAGYIFFGQKSVDQQGTAMTEANEVEAEASSEGQVWTCSMHPQIRQNEPGLCPICEMDLIPLTEQSSDDPLVLQMTNSAVKLAQIETTIVGDTKSGENTLTLSGKIKADERLSASQVAHIPGRIEQLFVTFTGEQVDKGQKLAVVYSPQLISSQQELIEALKYQGASSSLVSAARKKLEYWKISKEQIAEIERTGNIQELTTIYADASGIVTKRRVAVGDYVNQGEVMFDFVSLDRLWVLFDAYEDDLSSVNVGDRIAFTTAAMPSEVFSTKVTFIDPLINPETRAASVRAEVVNRGNLLKPEMYVRGTLRSHKHTGSAVMVPRSAVLWTGTRSVVYVKVPDVTIPSFRYREIDLGARVGDMYIVNAGLEPGEEVVTHGNFTIDAAAQLNNQASMMNKNVAVKGTGLSEDLPDFTDVTPDAFKNQISDLVAAYLALKDDLVASNGDEAAQHAASVARSNLAVDMSLVTGEAHQYWMTQQEAIRAHSDNIATLDDVEEQRQQFDFLSQALISSVKAFGIPASTYYVQHCPMAFDNQGADWLSDQAEIRNPYFGDKMMKCGINTDTITKEYRNPPSSATSRDHTETHIH